jgi:hypothetical protein
VTGLRGNYAGGRRRNDPVRAPAEIAAAAVDAELQTIADGLTLAVRSGAMTPARAFALGLAAQAVQRVRAEWRAEQGVAGGGPTDGP